MSQSDVDMDKVSFVISSSYREIVIDELLNQASTPSEIEEHTNIEVAHASRAIKELREEGLAELLVSEDRKKGRLYGLTDGGEEVVEFINNRE